MKIICSLLLVWVFGFSATIAFQRLLSRSPSVSFRPNRTYRQHQRSSWRLFENLGFRLSSAPSSKEDLSKWERMYEQGGMASQQNPVDVASSSKSEVRIVSFDLDNTLWKTGGVIGAANDALAAHLDANNIQQPKRVEKIMGELFQADRKRYCPLLENESDAKAPVLLTKLRTDAIQQVLEDHNEYTQEDAENFARECFEVWTKARHDAIPENFSTNVVECLEAISSMQTSQGQPVMICAITDGNSDPRKVEVLRKYFQFCVNAEQVGVCKPDRRVYLEAIRQVASHESFQDLNLLDKLENDEDDVEVGPYWVHIGDDFVKDIVAGKSLNMRTVWATELVRDKLNSTRSLKSSSDKGAQDRNAQVVQDFVKEISDKLVVEMAIGADSYLADSFTAEFVDAVTEEFHDLSDVLGGWHEEGQVMHQSTEEELSEELATSTTAVKKDSAGVSVGDDEVFTVVMPDDPSTISSQVSPRAFRISREGYSVDVAAPLQSRQTKIMKDVMGVAQLDKSSGVFAFDSEDVEAVRVGTKVLMIKIKGSDLEFSREIFASMSVEEVLSLSNENPMLLSLYIKDAAGAPSFDLF